MTLSVEDHLVVRHAFDARELVASWPPRFAHPHKQVVYALACPASAPPRGAVTYARFRAMPLPEAAPPSAPAVTHRDDAFSYETPPPGVVAWHLNFADPHLFFAYGSGLLAQDELQALEHPALGSLLEWLSASKDPRDRPVTEEDGSPTPVLVRGVERRCSLAIEPDPLEGRPMGLYGNRFARAKEDAVRRALTVLGPPTISNILAIAAPPGGRGPYEIDEIRGILVTATTGYRAAAAESILALPGARVEIHTGHWGTGAFGGDKVLMTMLQIFSARLAGIDHLVYHTLDPEGQSSFEEGRARIETLAPAGAPHRVEDVIRAIHAMGFVWGTSDGN
jgi:hypothetical protein